MLAVGLGGGLSADTGEWIDWEQQKVSPDEFPNQLSPPAGKILEVAAQRGGIGFKAVRGQGPEPDIDDSKMNGRTRGW